MSNSNNNSESFYTPPTTWKGDRDWRREVQHWMRERNKGAHPIDLNTQCVIDNLLDALDAARKERDEGRSPGAWKYIGSPNDRIP